MSLSRLRSEAVEEVERRFDAAEEYLRIILASYPHRLGPDEVLELKARLDACEDWITLDPHDWDRLRAILLPEYDSGTFRKYSDQALAKWSRLTHAVLPEANADPKGKASATAEVKGTAAKVEVMRLRETLGLPLYDERDARISDEQGLLCEAEAGNGRVAPASIDDVPVAKLLVNLRGEGRARIGETVVPKLDLAWRLPLVAREPSGLNVAVPESELEPIALAFPESELEPAALALFEPLSLPLLDPATLAQRCLWHALERCDDPCALDLVETERPARVKKEKRLVMAEPWLPFAG